MSPGAMPAGHAPIQRPSWVAWLADRPMKGGESLLFVSPWKALSPVYTTTEWEVIVVGPRLQTESEITDDPSTRVVWEAH